MFVFDWKFVFLLEEARCRPLKISISSHLPPAWSVSAEVTTTAGRSVRSATGGLRYTRRKRRRRRRMKKKMTKMRRKRRRTVNTTSHQR